VDSSFRSNRDDDEKEAMKFHELSATFRLFLGGLIISLIVFIFEVLYHVKLRSLLVLTREKFSEN
jgi:hypothetical protein